MDKKKAAAKANVKADVSGQSLKSSGRRPISKSAAGNTVEDIMKLEKAKAMKEAQEVFQEVRREYPAFREKTEEEKIQGGDCEKAGMSFHSPSRKGMEELCGSPGVRPTHLLDVQSQKVLSKNQNSENVKKGGSTQVVTAAPGDHRKQLKPTTMAKGRLDKKQIPEKSFIPPLPPGPPPKHAQRPPLRSRSIPVPKPPKGKEPQLVEVFSSKGKTSTAQNDTNAARTSSASDFFSVSSSSSAADFGKVEHEGSSPHGEIYDSPCDHASQAPPSTRVPEVFTPKAQKTVARTEETQLNQACKITVESAVDPSNWPVNKNPPASHEPYEPFRGGRYNRVPTPFNQDDERVEHDDFASEFIKSFEIKVDLFEKAPKPEMIVPASYMPLEGMETSAMPVYNNATLPLPMDSKNSLKLVHKFPLWPHQVPLHKVLCNLMTLKTLVLDDSEMTGIRDMGSSLPNLMTLSVIRCNLTTLDGMFALPNLENLFAANNKITSAAPLSCLGHIRFVDLSGNPITSLDGFKYLKECSTLKCLKLTDTPLVKTPGFQKTLRLIIPSLREVQPRNYIMGDEEDDDEELLCTPQGQHNWYDAKMKRNASVETASSGDAQALSSGVVDPVLEGRTAESCKSRSSGQLSSSISQGDSPSDGTDVYEADKEFDGDIEESEWRTAEKEIKNVYIPRRVEFKKRGPTVIPSDIDEMDALLDELENSGISGSEMSAMGSRAETSSRPF